LNLPEYAANMSFTVLRLNLNTSSHSWHQSCSLRKSSGLNREDCPKRGLRFWVMNYSTCEETSGVLSRVRNRYLSFARWTSSSRNWYRMRNLSGFKAR
jgi:hypothetical protein